MIYPVRFPLAVVANVTCKVNAMGGTTVSADYCGAKFADEVFDDYNVDTQGYDGLTERIQSAFAGQIEDALRAAS